ncbi:MAG TPA: MFS transporter [Gammaproteobacteria bacterium]|nr:MFS transporter [Gammaproteobacteria bacterium]
MTRPDPAPAEAWPRPAYAWYVVGVMLLAYVLSFVDRTILSLLVIPIEHDLHIGDTAMSLLQGFSFAILYAIMGLPIARLIDAHTRRGIIGAGIFLWSLMTASCGLANRFWHLFLSRVGVGIGEATLLPGASSLLADYFPPQKLGRAMGVFATGIFVGTGLSLIIGGSLIKALHGVRLHLAVLGSVHSWQIVFFAVGVPGILVALLMLTVREPARRGTLRTRLQDGVRVTSHPSVREVVRYMRDNRRTMTCHHLGFSLLALVGYGSGAWIPTFFIRTYGWTASQAGIRFGLLAFVFGPLGTVLGGWLADRYARRGRQDGKMRVGMIAALGGIVPVCIFPMAGSAGWALGLISPFFLFVSFVWGIAPAALQELLPNQMRGQVTAFYTGVLNLIGLGMGPTSVALITDYAFHNPQDLRYSMAIVGVVGLALAALVFRAGFGPYRRSLDYLHAWEREGAHD